MNLWQGVGVALATPFDNNGNVNYAEAAELLRHVLDGGADALIALGTTGEPSTMTAAERDEFLKFCIAETKKRVPVIAGCGSNSTAETVSRGKRAKELGADGLLVVTPYYNKCTQNGILEHYRAVGENVDLPITAYNVPSRTGVNIAPETAAKLSGIKNLVAIKEASGNIANFTETARLVEGKLDVYVGDDAMITAGYALGAKGVISVAANIVPSMIAKLCKLCKECDYASARSLQFKLAPFINNLFSEVNPIPVKKALEFIGIKAGAPRLPLTEMEKPHADALKKAMTELGVKVID